MCCYYLTYFMPCHKLRSDECKEEENICDVTTDCTVTYCLIPLIALPVSDVCIGYHAISFIVNRDKNIVGSDCSQHYVRHRSAAVY